MSKLENNTYTLKHTITKGGADLTELVFVRPKIKHLKRMGDGGNEEEKIILLICAVTSQSETLIDEMDLEDFAEVVKIVTDFLPKSLGVVGKK